MPSTPTNTGGGTTVSFNNTPQAKDDVYTFTEDQLLASGLYNVATSTIILDVMSNDLGGNAKSLYSVDDGGTGALQDLLTSNVTTGWERTSQGWIRINAGKIEYRIDGGSHDVNNPLNVNTLGIGETISDSFVYAIRLGNGTLSYATVSITLTGSNDGPVARVDVAGTNEDDAVTINVLANDTDVDVHDVLTITTANVASGGGSVSIVDNKLVYNPGTAYNSLAAGQTATVTINYSINDGHGGTASSTATVNILGTNDAAVLSSATANLTEGNTAAAISTSGTLTISDVDSDETFVAQTDVPGDYGSFSIDADGNWTYTASSAHNEFVDGQTYTDTFSVSSADGTLTSVTVNILGTNDAPTAPAVNVIVGEDTIINGQLPGSDVDGGALTYTFNGGTPPGFTLNGDGSYTWDTNGAYDFLYQNQTADFITRTYTVTDSSGASATGSIFLRVNGTNDAPTATNMSSAETYTEDTPLNLTDIVVSDPDTPVTMTLTLSNAAAGSLSTGTSGAVTSTYNAATGVWSASGAVASINALLAGVAFVPTANYNGNFTIATSVSDGVAPAVTGVKVVTGVAVNDAPTAAPVTLSVIAEDSGPRLITQAELLAGASDADNASLTITSLSIAPGGNGSLVANGDGTWTYSPAFNDDTGVTFNYTVTDGALTASSTASLDITPVNDAPLNAVPGAQSATAGTAKAIADIIVTDVDSTALTTSVKVLHGTISVSTGGGAGIVGNGTGEVVLTGTQLQINTALAGLTYTATSGYSGSDTLTVNTSDGSLSDLDTVAITVTGADVLTPNDVVFTLSPSTAGLTGTNLTGQTIGSFTAVDGDSSAWTFGLSGTNASSFALSGTGLQSSTDLTFLTNLAPGQYSFVVTATDGAGHFKTETFNVTVGQNSGDASTWFTVSSGTDISLGLNGADVINGGDGDDALVGGQNGDTLNGQLGNDQLIGGAQGDNFVFDTTLNATTNVDRILDFEAGNNGGGGVDKIVLDDDIFTAFSLAGLTNAQFVSNGLGAAVGTGAQIIFNSATGTLVYDSNGTQAGGATHFATLELSGMTGTLDASDFIIIG